MHLDTLDRVHGFLDQVVSSGSNFATGFVLARELGPASFGSFVLVYSIWVVFLSLVRSLLIQPFVIEVASLDGQTGDAAMKLAAQAVFLVSALTSTCAFGLALLGLDGELRLALLALGLVLPALAIQDLIRFIAFASRTARTALVNDLCFVLTQGAVLAVLLATHTLSAPTSLIAWGVGASAGCWLGGRQVGLRFASPREGLRWARSAFSAGKWFTLSTLIFAAGLHGSMLLVSIRYGRTAVGGMRAVVNLMAPAQMFLGAMESVGLPAAVRQLAEHPSKVRTPAMRTSLLVFVFAVVFGGLLLAVGPRVVTGVFGSSFRAYEPLLLPSVLGVIAASFGIGPILGLRAALNGRKLVEVQSVSSALRLIAGAATLTWLTPLGLVWCLSAAALIQSGLYWHEFMKGTP